MPRRRKVRAERPARPPADGAAPPTEALLAAFGDALISDFKTHGAAAIAAARDKDPVTYLKICASILPKPVAAEADPLGALNDDQLLERARTAAASLGLRLEPQPGGAPSAAKPTAD